MRKRYWFLLVAVLMVGVVSLGYRLPVASSASADAYAARIRTCALGMGSSWEAQSLSAMECISSALGDAYDAGVVAEVVDDLDALTQEDPVLRENCHTAVHHFLEGLSVTEDGLWLLLDETGSFPDCQWAFGMATLVGLADLGPSVYVRGEVLEWCDGHRGDLGVYGNCIHTVGHHAWRATRSVTATAMACSDVLVLHRQACAGGAFMEMFAPVDGSSPTYERALAPTAVPALCAEWWSILGFDEDVSCEYGAGYVYSADVHDAAAAAARKDGTSAADTAFVVEMFRAAVGYCSDLRGRPSDVCESMLVAGIPREFSVRLPDAHAALCGMLETPAARAACELREGV